MDPKKKKKKKKSIINIQDLGLSAASQHSVSEQPILRVILRKLSIFRKFFQDICGQPIP
jgi:hypothetical protein